MNLKISTIRYNCLNFACIDNQQYSDEVVNNKLLDKF